VNGYLFDPEEEDFGAIAATQRLLEQQQERETIRKMPWKQNAGMVSSHTPTLPSSSALVGAGEWEKAMPPLPQSPPSASGPRCYGKDLRQFAVAFFERFNCSQRSLICWYDSLARASQLFLSYILTLGKFLQIENQVFWLDLTVVAAARIYKIRPVCHRSPCSNIVWYLS